MHTYIYIYIYICIERERESEREISAPYIFNEIVLVDTNLIAIGDTQ